MLQAKVELPLDSIQSLCRRYQIRELALFGSALRDDFTAESDLDFLVEFQPEARVGFMRLSQVQRELAALLHRPVDLVPKGGLKSRIREQVLATAEVIYAA